MSCSGLNGQPHSVSKVDHWHCSGHKEAPRHVCSINSPEACVAAVCEGWTQGIMARPAIRCHEQDNGQSHMHAAPPITHSPAAQYRSSSMAPSSTGRTHLGRHGPAPCTCNVPMTVSCWSPIKHGCLQSRPCIDRLRTRIALILGSS